MEVACFKHPPTYALIIHCRQRKEKAIQLFREMEGTLVNLDTADPTLFVVKLNGSICRSFLGIPSLI